MKPVNIKEFRNKHIGKAWGQLFQVVTIICTWSKVFHHQKNCLAVLIQVQRGKKEKVGPLLFTSVVRGEEIAADEATRGGGWTPEEVGKLNWGKTQVKRWANRDDMLTLEAQ